MRQMHMTSDRFNNDSVIPYKLYRTIDLLALEDSPNAWIVRGMIPSNGRTLVHGKGGDYKSTVMFDLGIAVASHGELMQQFPVMQTGPVILISTEGSIFKNRDRILSHIRPRNVHPAKVDLHYGKRGLPLDTEIGIRTLEKMVDELKPVLVIIDPLVSFFRGDENSAKDVGRFTQPLDELIDHYKFSLLAIHHSNKNKDIRGSSAFQAWFDSVLEFDVTRDVSLPGIPKPVHVLKAECKKMRDGETGRLFTVVPMIDTQIKQTVFGIYDGIEAENVGRVYLRQEVYKKLIELGPLTKNQLRGLFGVGLKKIDEAIQTLELTNAVEATEVMRPTNAAGTRVRSAEGWKIKAINNVVDNAHAIIHKSSSEPDGEVAYAVDERVPGGFCLAGIPKRPKLQVVR